MATTLAIVSLLIIGLCLYGLFRPSDLVGLARSFLAPGRLWFPIAVRLLFAGLLWFTAPQSLTPLVFRVLAVLALLAAVTPPLIGLATLHRLVDGYASLPAWMLRLQCLLGCAFGVYLLWSIAPALGIN